MLNVFSECMDCSRPRSTLATWLSSALRWESCVVSDLYCWFCGILATNVFACTAVFCMCYELCHELYPMTTVSVGSVIDRELY